MTAPHPRDLSLTPTAEVALDGLYAAAFRRFRQIGVRTDFAMQLISWGFVPISFCPTAQVKREAS